MVFDEDILCRPDILIVVNLHDTKKIPVGVVHCLDFPMSDFTIEKSFHTIQGID